MFDQPPLDDLCVGKTISLERAAKLLSDIDNDEPCQRWTLRFCLSKFVKVCIKLPSPVLTWEREKEPDYDSNLPIMGMGDYIDRRTGILFLPHSVVENFTYPDSDEESCSRFYVRDESWSSGFKEVEIASRRHYLQQIYKDALDEPPATSGYLKRSQDEIREYIEAASNDSYLSIGIENLYIWKEDFEAALNTNDEKLAARQEQPMYKSEPEKAKPQASKTINKMCLVIYGMAVEKYGYNPDESRNQATGRNSGSIQAGLDRIGINVDAETIRNYIKQGHDINSKNDKTSLD
ncbi:MAG: hypothetical protein R3F02_06955 [Thiolinea sp.]